MKKFRPFRRVFSTAVLPRSPYHVELQAKVEANTEEKKRLVEELIKTLKGNIVPDGETHVAIEVDGPSHFYVNSTKYTAYTKLKHRILVKMGYKVIHVPFFEWNKLGTSAEKEFYLRTKLEEHVSEFLDPADQKYFSSKETQPV